MRTQEILIIVWFVIAVLLDKFIESYYNIILLTISLAIVITIRLLNKRDRSRKVTVVDIAKS